LSLYWPDFYLQNLAYINHKPVLSGELKSQPEDFIVKEILGFNLSGQGDHLCLFIEKWYLNTRDIVQSLADHFEVQSQSIGYCGLKDKFALTRQWFSVDLSVSRFAADHLKSLVLDDGFASDESDAPNTAGFKILKTDKNIKKLRLGNHRANDFELTIKNIIFTEANNSESKLIKNDLEAALSAVKSRGFPNYFGEQRFGFAYSNLKQLDVYQSCIDVNPRFKMKRNKRSMLISSLRSVIFNAYLSHRLTARNWSQYVCGDVLNLRGSHSLFNIADDSNEVKQVTLRLDQGDIYISGPMVGDNSFSDDKLANNRTCGDIIDEMRDEKHEKHVRAVSGQMESELVERFSNYRNILKKNKVKASRRALACIPEKLSWALNNNTLVLKVELPSGVFATALLRELFVLNGSVR